MQKIPKSFTRFMAEYPDIARAYRELGDAVDAAGPLDTKTQALFKFGMAVGSGHEGSAKSQARKCIDAGATKEELHHAAMQAIPTLGFASMMRSMTWIDEAVNVIDTTTPEPAGEGDQSRP